MILLFFSRTLGTNRRRQSFAFYDNISKVFLLVFDNISKSFMNFDNSSKLLNKSRFRRADAVRASSRKFAQVRAIISPAIAGLILSFDYIVLNLGFFSLSFDSLGFFLCDFTPVVYRV